MRYNGEEIEFLSDENNDLADLLVCGVATGRCPDFGDEQFGLCIECRQEIQFNPEEVIDYQNKEKICIPCFNRKTMN